MELTIPMWLLWVVGVIISLAFLFVFVVGVKVVEDIENQMKEIQERLRNAEQVIRFYAVAAVDIREPGVNPGEFGNLGDNARRYLDNYKEPIEEVGGSNAK